VNSDERGLTWQVGVWDQTSHLYGSDLDKRFSSVVDAVINRASLRGGELVLDLGTETGAVAIREALSQHHSFHRRPSHVTCTFI